MWTWRFLLNFRFGLPREDLRSGMSFLRICGDRPPVGLLSGKMPSGESALLPTLFDEQVGRKRQRSARRTGTAIRGKYSHWDHQLYLSRKSPTPKYSATLSGSGRLCWARIFSKSGLFLAADRKSTRLNSSHGYISYAVFCLRKKKSES